MWQTRPRLSRVLMIVLVAFPLGLGVFFRVTHIDRKVFWCDEVYTLLWLSATDPKTLPPDWFDGREVSAADILAYQEICPERGLSGTIRTLATCETQQPPAYITLTWLLSRCCGSTAVPARIVSIFFGLLILPGMYWLCWEGFADRRAAWLGTTLMSVSPVYFLYAQEARQYSLWALTIVLSSAALLRASRTRTPQSWLLFGLLSVLGLYSHLLHLLVLLAQGGWTLVRSIGMESQGDRTGRRLLGAFLAVSGVALLLFIPWGQFVLMHRVRIAHLTQWLSKPPSSPYTGQLRWALTHAFIDGWYDAYHPWFEIVLDLHLAALAIGILWFLWRCPKRQTWLLAFLLTVVPFAALAGLDLICGGRRSTQTRYLFPCHLGLMLAVVIVLMNLLESPHRVARVVGRAMAGFLIAVALAGTAVAWQADAWWNKGMGWTDELQAIRCINESKHPLVVSGPVDEEHVDAILELGHLLDPHVRFRMVAQPDHLDIPAEFTDVYLVNIPDECRARIESRGRLERMSGKRFWHCCK